MLKRKDEPSPSYSNESDDEEESNQSNQDNSDIDEDEDYTGTASSHISKKIKVIVGKLKIVRNGEDEEEERKWLQTSNHNTRIDKDDSKVNLSRFLKANFNVVKQLISNKWPTKLHQFENVKGDPIKQCKSQSQPDLIVGGEMKSYQLEGLDFMRMMHDNGAGCILGDEMGLGKTLQIISHLVKLKEDGKSGPSLIVVPMSIVLNWKNEFTRWAPHMKVLIYHGGVNEISKVQKASSHHSFDVMITTYGIMTGHVSWLRGTIFWRCLILDEGHAIKNDQSLQHQAACSIKACQKIILTGTPLQNDLCELWSLLKFILPDVFDYEHTKSIFESAFNRTTHYRDEGLINSSSDILKILMLRRLKIDLPSLQIPAIEEIDIFLPISPTQRAIYKALLMKLDEDTLHGLLANDENANEKDRAAVSRITTVGKDKIVDPNQMVHLLSALMKCCNHPFILNPDLANHDVHENEDFINCSSKLLALDKLLPYLKAKKSRPLLFSKSTKVLNLLEKYCNWRGYVYCRLDGATPQALREFEMARFNHPKSNVFMFLISTRAGGLGLNLQTSDSVIFHDSDWNPQADIQAMARAHRIGQTKPVTVYRFSIQATLEERILQVARKKLELSVSVNGSDPFASKEIDGGQVRSMIRFGANQFVMQRPDKFHSFFKQGIEDILKKARDSGMQEVEESVRPTSDTPDVILDENIVDASLSNGAPPPKLRHFEGIEHDVDRKDDVDDNIMEVKRVKVDRVRRIDGFDVLISTIPIEDLVPDSEDEDSYAFKKKHKDLMRSWKREKVCFACNDFADDHRMFETCTDCPRVFHYDCIGVGEYETIQSMRCSQHKCCHQFEEGTENEGSYCLKSSADAGNCLFRCDSCPRSFCWQHLPKDDDFPNWKTEVPKSLQDVGYVERKSVVFVKCFHCRSGKLAEDLDVDFFVGTCSGTYVQNPGKGWYDRNKQHTLDMDPKYQLELKIQAELNAKKLAHEEKQKKIAAKKRVEQEKLKKERLEQEKITKLTQAKAMENHRHQQSQQQQQRYLPNAPPKPQHVYSSVIAAGNSPITDFYQPLVKLGNPMNGEYHMPLATFNHVPNSPTQGMYQPLNNPYVSLPTAPLPNLYKDRR